MTDQRLPDYLEHMRQAAMEACGFADGMSKDDFVADKRTQKAVVMSIVIIGEAATKIMEGSHGFASAHPQIPWRSMRGMRNRIAHGYFDINLDVVWDTVKTALPELLRLLPAACTDAATRSHADDGASGHA